MKENDVNNNNNNNKIDLEMLSSPEDSKVENQCNSMLLRAEEIGNFGRIDCRYNEDALWELVADANVSMDRSLKSKVIELFKQRWKRMQEQDPVELNEWFSFRLERKRMNIKNHVEQTEHEIQVENEHLIRMTLRGVSNTRGIDRTQASTEKIDMILYYLQQYCGCNDADFFVMTSLLSTMRNEVIHERFVSPILSSKLGLGFG